MDSAQIIFDIFYYAVFALAAVFFCFRLFKPKPEEAILRSPLKYACLKVFAIAVLSRLALLLLNWGVQHLLGNGGELPDTWFRWDADNFMAIATQGYWSAELGWKRIVFMPLYPMAVRIMTMGFIDVKIAAMIVSWLSLGGACVYLYKLVLLDADEAAARRAVKFLLIFPVTVFLGAPFTESMFLLLSLACFYHMRKRQFLAACVFGFLAALTRNVGVLLALPVFIEILKADGILPHGSTPRSWRRFFCHSALLLLIPAGTFCYLLMNDALTGDMFMFLKMEELWSQRFGSYGNTLHVSWEQILSNRDLREKLTLWGSQFVVMVVAGATLPVLCSKTRASYGVYTIAYLFVIFAPTWLLSGFRYYMGLAVLYPALAMMTRKRWADIALTVLFALLMPIYTYCFSVGWMVF